MSIKWPQVELGALLTQYEHYIDSLDARMYPKLSVKLYGKGVVLDTPVDGATVKMKRHQLAQAGQVILSEIWGKKGAIGLVPDQGEGALCTSHFFLFDAMKDRICRGWLRAIFRADYLADQLGATAFGTTGYAAVRPRSLLAAKIPLPPLPQQRRIVAKIDRLAAKVEETRGLRGRCQEAAEALIPAETTAVFRKLTDYPRLPIRQLGVAGSNPVQTGPFGAQLHASEFVDVGVPVLNVGNVWPKGLRLDRLDYVSPAKARQLARYALKADDVLFARSGATLGKVCVLPRRCDGWLMTGHLFRVRLDQSKCLPQFAFSALRGARCVRDQVFAQIRGATRPGFNTKLLGNVELPQPPVREQRRIVEYLDRLQAKVDRLKEVQAKTAAELDALLPSILDKAFKGEL